MAARIMNAQAQVCDAITLSRESSASTYTFIHTHAHIRTTKNQIIRADNNT